MSKNTNEIQKRGFIKDEQEKLDTVSVVYDPNAPKRKLNRVVVEENIATSDITKSSFKMRDYKQKLYQEFMNDCTLAQIGTSPWSTFLNVLNVIIVSLVLLVSVSLSIGMLAGLRPDVVVTNSMEPNIPVNSIVIVAPVSWDDINVGDHISYYRNENGQLINYIHRVSAKGSDYLVMVGENPNTAFLRHVVSKDAIQGRELVVIPYVGGIFVWVKNNAILTFMILFTVVVGMLLARKLIDENHVNTAFAEYVKRRVDFEQQMKFQEEQETTTQRKKALDSLLKRKY